VSWAHPQYGNLIASCGFDKKVVIWKECRDQSDWQEVYSYNEHQGSGIFR